MSVEKSVYDAIAKDYHLKKRKPWKAFENFIEFLRKKDYDFSGYTIDLGCANGRNFEVLSNSVTLIGIDNSFELLNIAKTNLRNFDKSKKDLRNKIHLILSDIRYIPLRFNSVNNIFSIATIHHLKTKSEREKVIAQIYELLKFGGYCFITVWRKYQKKYRSFYIKDLIKRTYSPTYKKKQELKGLLNYGDIFIPWTVSSKKETYSRFYHLFSKREAKHLIKKFKIQEFHKFGGPNKEDNFFILVQKL